MDVFCAVLDGALGISPVNSYSGYSHTAHNAIGCKRYLQVGDDLRGEGVVVEHVWPHERHRGVGVPGVGLVVVLPQLRYLLNGLQLAHPVACVGDLH